MYSAVVYYLWAICLHKETCLYSAYTLVLLLYCAKQTDPPFVLKAGILHQLRISYLIAFSLMMQKPP